MDDLKNYPVYARIYNLRAVREDDTLEEPHQFTLPDINRWLLPQEFEAFIEKNNEVIE